MMSTPAIALLEVAAMAGVFDKGGKEVSTKELIVGAMSMVGIFGAVGYAAYSKHFREYQFEYANLYQALHSSKNRKFMRTHFPTRMAKYWIVDAKGELVPTQKNPMIFGRPLGRRRIPNNIHGRKTRSKETWMRKPMRGWKLHW